MGAIEDKLNNIVKLVLETSERAQELEVTSEDAFVGEYLAELFNTTELSDSGCTAVGLLYVMELLGLIEFKEIK